MPLLAYGRAWRLASSRLSLLIENGDFIRQLYTIRGRQLSLRLQKEGYDCLFPETSCTSCLEACSIVVRITFVFFMELVWRIEACGPLAAEALPGVMSPFVPASSLLELALVISLEMLTPVQRILPLPIIEDSVSTGVASTP